MLLNRGESLIKLNVGGVMYTCTKSVLTRYPNNVLASLVLGKSHPPTDDQGNVFVDRNGRVFEHVLTFLRTRRIVLPAEFRHMEALCVEAEYYGIAEFTQALGEYKQMQWFPARASQEVLICWLLGHDAKNTGQCHYQIYCKAVGEGWKMQTDYTYGGKLTLQTFHNYMEGDGDWRLVKSETMSEPHAAAFFLSMGVQESPFKKELSYTNVKVERWKMSHVI